MARFYRRELDNHLLFLKEIFDVVRIIEPNNKKVIHYEGGDSIVHSNSCYNFWGKKSFCDNCISNRAMVERRTITRIEYNGDSIYLVMSSPVQFENEVYIFEMIKDITDTEVARNLRGNVSEETINIISRLSNKIITDELTGVYNRRFINERLQRDIDEILQNKEQFSIIMLDIDYFKEINDIYGHMAGDLVLKTLASIINSKINKNYDWVARYGGDEFIIFLKNADRKTVRKIIEEIQIDFKYSEIRYDNYLIQTTISFGTYTYDGNNANMEEIINIADINLNKAKKSGRNMVIST